jgi:hypothetical protein
MGMNREQIGDLTILLYAAPFLVGALGWIYHYIFLNTVDRSLDTLYIVVSKDPIIFLAGFFCTISASVLDIRITREELDKVVARLQEIALALLIVEVIGALIVIGFTGNAARIFYLFLDGKYSVVLPLLMFIYAYLISLSKSSLINLNRKLLMTTVSIILMIAAPVYLFYMGAIHSWDMMYYVQGVGIFLVGFVSYILSSSPTFGKRQKSNP